MHEIHSEIRFHEIFPVSKLPNTRKNKMAHWKYFTKPSLTVNCTHSLNILTTNMVHFGNIHKIIKWLLILQFSG